MPAQSHEGKPMTSGGSVSHWIGELQAGNHAAAQKLWEDYFQRLVALARKRLHNRPRRAADEEDVALSAFDSFCRAAEKGRFPQLRDRNDLWRLLVVITIRKASQMVRAEQRQKRGGGTVRGESALSGMDAAAGELGFDCLVGREPTAEFVLQVAEEYERLLTSLGNDQLRLIAVAKMEGDTTEQIAAKLGCAGCTVERRLRLIRSIWEKEVSP